MRMLEFCMQLLYFTESISVHILLPFIGVCVHTCIHTCKRVCNFNLRSWNWNITCVHNIFEKKLIRYLLK